MADDTPIYDLTLLLSTSASDEQRQKILSDVESAISAGEGSTERNDRWGVRNLSYAIEHQADAEYHLLQFTGPPSLLETLGHNLRITDGLVRFRIIKVRSGIPPAPSAPPVIVSAGADSTADE